MFTAVAEAFLVPGGISYTWRHFLTHDRFGAAHGVSETDTLASSKPTGAHGAYLQDQVHLYSRVVAGSDSSTTSTCSSPWFIRTLDLRMQAYTTYWNAVE